MNTTEQAKNGFKTFIITLSVSLVVFTAIYYVVSDGSTVNIESDTLGAETTKDRTSVFGKLTEEQSEPKFLASAETKPETPTPKVLAGSDVSTEASESTTPVPDTGSTEMTIALISAIVTIGGAGYLAVNNPRKRALVGFERDILKEL